jgi:hypothetical protein
MKTLPKVTSAIALTLLCIGNATAQTLKWSHTRPGGLILARAGDGYGGFAVIYRIGQTEESARIVWIAANGAVLLDREIERVHEDAPVDVVRMTPGEFAIRYAAPRPAPATPANLLLRFKRTRKAVAVLERTLEPDEDMPTVPERLTDPFGFFTFAATDVRRYSN